MRSEDRTPGQLLREARLSHGVSQKRLAIRAGTTQSAISRIEQNRVSPTVATLRGLLHMLGEDLTLALLPRDAGIDISMIRSNLALTPAQRLSRADANARFVMRNRGKAAP